MQVIGLKAHIEDCDYIKFTEGVMTLNQTVGIPMSAFRGITVDGWIQIAKADLTLGFNDECHRPTDLDGSIIRQDGTVRIGLHTLVGIGIDLVMQLSDCQEALNTIADCVRNAEDRTQPCL